ncbi:MAG: cation:proton antiporter [Ignavibacteria bacterium]
MMSIIRKLVIIFILILLINLFGFLQVDVGQIFHADTLISLGFILIAAFSFGELINMIGLPKISGYLIAGIIFGPYSNLIFQTKFLSIFTDTAINDLKLLNGLAIGLIAISAGGEIVLKEFLKEKKVISLIILLKLIFIPTVIFGAVLIVAPYIPLFNGQPVNLIIISALFTGILMLATSPAATIAVMNETGDRSKLSQLVLSIAVVKDILLVILISLLIAFSKGFINPKGGFNSNVILSGFIEIFLSIMAGVVAAYLIILYLRYVKAEMLIFVLSTILIISELSKILHIDVLLVFITIGFFIRNFSIYSKDLIEPIEKLSLPVYVIFFTIAGAGLNLNALILTFQLTALVFVLRLILIYSSTKIATKLAGEILSIQNNLWLGFVSQSAMALGFMIYFTANVNQVQELITPIVISIVGFNLLVGPALFKIAIKRFNQRADEIEKKPKKIDEQIKKEVFQYKKFDLPQFEDPELNNLILSLRDKLIDSLKEFETTLINKRSEDALEFYYQVVEKYIEEYQKLKNLFTKGKVTGKEIKAEVLKTQQEISSWFAELSIQRKTIEQQILNAEYLLQKLFDELKGYCETVPEFIIVEQELDKYEKELDDSSFIRFAKFYKRILRSVRKAFGIKSGLKRKIPYVTLVKYFFEYQIALEMEQAAFLMGLERLNILRKIKRIFDDVTNNFEELLNLISEYKDIDAVSLLAIDKLNEIHDRLKQEISSIGEEIESSNQNISTRLNYAFATPFNQFLKAILKAGTVELNIRKFHFSKIYSKTLKAKETTLETIRFWVNYFIGFLGVCERDARIFELTGKINSLINDTMIHHSDTINSELRELINEINSLLKSFENELADKKLLSFDRISIIKNLIQKYRDEVILVLNEKGIARLNSLKKTYSLVNTINSLKERFNSIIKEYENEIKVLDENDFEIKETRTKYIELKVLHFAEVIKNYFDNEILQEIIKLNEIVNGHLTSSIFELKNIENVIYYHFNIALEEINSLEKESDPDKIGEDLQKVFEDTLKTTTRLIRDKIKIWNRQIEKFEREIEVSLTEKIYKQINTIKDSFRKELTQTLEKRIKKNKFQEFLETLSFLLKENYRGLKKQWLLIKRKYNQILQPLLREAKEKLELKPEGESIIIYSYEQTIYDKKVYDSLPFIYKKLFDYTSSEIIEILVGREKEKAILQKAYERTLNGLSGSAAIIGESGTGKSSLISSFIMKAQIDTQITSYTFEKTIKTEKELLKTLSEILGLDYIASPEELIGELNINPKYKVVILEDIHKIFLRKYGHLEAMKKLLLIISETGNKIFWIVSISYHAWELLNRILRIGNFFPFQIMTEVLTKEQIKEAILKRHKTSGYDLEFLPGEQLKTFKQLRSKFSNKDKQTNLEDEYFDRLYEACEGNITSAMFYWMKSIKEFKNNKIFIMPFKKLDFRFLKNFEIETLLTLSNLIQHGSLTISEHQEIFNFSKEKSKTILNFLNAANLIHFDLNEFGEQVYYINPALYKPIEIELRNLHIF